MEDLNHGSVPSLVTTSSAAECVCELWLGSCSVPVGVASACSAPPGRSTLPVGVHDVYLSGGPGSGSGVHSTHRFDALSLWTLLWGYLC